MLIRMLLPVMLAVVLALSAGSVSPLDPKAGEFLDVDLEALAETAFRLYQQGDYLEAADLYLDLLKHDINNPVILYRLAGCFGLLGEPELAGRYLSRAFRAGFRDIGHVRQDPDFHPVAGKLAFRRVVDSLARAQEDRERAFGVRIPVAARSYLDCRVKLPFGFDPQKRYALVVGLHGHDDNHERFTELWQRFGPDPQFIFACPQAPYPAVSSNSTWRTNPGSSDGLSWVKEADSAVAATIRAATEEYILDVVRLLSARYSVGDVYLLGFGQGADVAWAAGLRHPRHFSGLVCFSGRLDTVWVRPSHLEAGRRLRVFVGHGRDDESVGYENAVTARELLAAHDYDVSLLSHDAGHSIPRPVARQIVDWLFRARQPGRTGSTDRGSPGRTGER